MPEMPEVEILVRHLAPLIRGRRIRDVRVNRAKVVAPATPGQFKDAVHGATFLNLSRRGKYLLFALDLARQGKRQTLVGHLGMTGRMYLLPANAPLPKHAAVVLNLGRDNFVFEDTRYFGRLTLDAKPIASLGPEPLTEGFTPEHLALALKRSAQPIKARLLDQGVAAGVGNIYASEALFRARISPQTPARRLGPTQISRLWQAIRETLAEALEGGSTVPLSYSGARTRDGLYYFGRAPGVADYYEERLRVYGRAGKACPRCGRAIKRLVQGGRSTFYCPRCQK